MNKKTLLTNLISKRTTSIYKGYSLNLQTTFFDNIQNKIELIDNSIKSQKKSEEFVEKYCDVEAKLVTFIDEFKTNSDGESSSTSETSNHTFPQSISNARLPQLNLPTFKGNYINCTAFHILSR